LRQIFPVWQFLHVFMIQVFIKKRGSQVALEASSNEWDGELFISDRCRWESRLLNDNPLHEDDPFQQCHYPTPD
jgi:hypothetical protein